MTARTRVVVTGIGTTNPVGGDAPSTWEALIAGRSGVRALTEDWVEDLAVKIGAPVLVDAALLLLAVASPVPSAPAAAVPPAEPSAAA